MPGDADYFHDTKCHELKLAGSTSGLAANISELTLPLAASPQLSTLPNAALRLFWKGQSKRVVKDQTGALEARWCE